MTIPFRSIRPALTDDVADGLTIADPGGVAPISVSDDESAAVRIAAANLADDLRRVCPPVGGSTGAGSGARVVVGTLGTSAEVDDAVASGLLDPSPILDERGRPRWEAFLSATVGDVLYLVGADRRGTVYAVYDLAEAAGVSPWTWWGDVPVRTRGHVTIRRAAVAADWPSVRYRGIFINDEEELDAWARLHTADGTIGPETYARVFELILRLRGNYIWPAMHVGAFNHDPENGRLAHELGVVVGTSHCDMLLRSNEHEFRPWAAAREEPVEYDYSLPGRNRGLLRDYWRGSVAQNRDYEVTWTVGMRGIHDYGFQTTAIDTDETLSAEEKFHAKVRLLGEVMQDQRQLLSEELGVSASGVPQLFVPYKEVLPLYDAGLEVPDDVTIVWANDNFGHLRRLPAGAELERSGGHGLYYHSSYWSNLTTSYLATSSTPLALMKAELARAWEGGIRQLWVDNIGGIKPLEQEVEFFLRSAWDAGKETVTADVETFTADWIDRQFTGGHGRGCAEIYSAYYQLNDQRKLEHLAARVFPQVGHGDEAGRRLERLRLLYEQTNDVLASLPEGEQDAFLQLFAVKIHLAYLTGAQFRHADRSTLAHAQGKLAAADLHLDLSRAFDANKRALVHCYNHVMAGGRWRGIFTPEDFPPPVMPLHPAGTPALRIDGAGMGVLAWGQSDPTTAPRLEFHPHGTLRKWIEVFAAGAEPVEYKLEAEPWLRLSHASGTVAAEVRISVELADPFEAAGLTGAIRVTSRTTGQVIDVAVSVAPEPVLPPGFVGVIEADGYVSIDPSHPDGTTPGPSSWWETAPHLGRYGNAALTARNSCPEVRATASLEGRHQQPATAEFHFHLTTPGAHLLELHRLPTLDSTGRIRVGVSLDDHPAVVVESPTTDEHRGNWASAIQDNVERLRLYLPAVEAGSHVLRLHAIDDGVTLSKLVIHTAPPAPSNLGPEFSSHTDRPAPPVEEPDPAAVDVAALARDARRLYRTDPAALPGRGQVYAGPRFWEGPTTFRPNTVVPQPALGPPRFRRLPDGTKDVLAELGSGTASEAGGVVALEAEYALAGNTHAWTTPSLDDPGVAWTHTQAVTDGDTGLAMHVAPRGLSWTDPGSGPGLHYAVDFTTAGSYRVWLLVKYDDAQDDACVLALDGQLQPPSEQFCGGELATYGTRQVWVWAALSDLDITAGRHTLSLFAAKSALRVDRIYLTTGDDLPPIDADWRPSNRS